MIGIIVFASVSFEALFTKLTETIISTPTSTIATPTTAIVSLDFKDFRNLEPLKENIEAITINSSATTAITIFAQFGSHDVIYITPDKFYSQKGASPRKPFTAPSHKICQPDMSREKTN